MSLSGNGMMDMPHPNRESSGASARQDAGALSENQSELAELRERERQMMELLGSTSRERLIHDLRNALNELQLLRAIIEKDKA